MHEFQIFDKRGEFLGGQGYNDSTQFGEDGYIQAALDRIGAKNYWCFEVGAADGEFYSNTKRLRDRGWFSVLIEKDPVNYEKLIKFAGPRVKTYKADVTVTALDVLLSMAMAPGDPDLGVIDIDGQDYHVWKAMTHYHPRLMLVEYSPYGTPDDMPETPPHRQAGLNPILALGKEKGYFPLIATYCNVLFCREDQWQ